MEPRKSTSRKDDGAADHDGYQHFPPDPHGRQYYQSAPPPPSGHMGFYGNYPPRHHQYPPPPYGWPGMSGGGDPMSSPPPEGFHAAPPPPFDHRYDGRRNPTAVTPDAHVMPPAEFLSPPSNVKKRSLATNSSLSPSKRVCKGTPSFRHHCSRCWLSAAGTALR